MKSSEVRKLKNEQLALEIRSMREKLFRLRQQAVTEKVADVSQFRQVRRDVARLLTEQRARDKAPLSARARAKAKARAKMEAAAKGS